MYLRHKKYIESSEDSLSTKTESSWVGMSIETKKHLSTSTEKIEEDISMLSGNLEGENLYLYDTLRDKMSGMEMESVS